MNLVLSMNRHKKTFSNYITFSRPKKKTSASWGRVMIIWSCMRRLIMREISFLVGSGISLASGVKGVADVTTSVLTTTFFEHTDGSFIKGKHPSEYLREHYDVEPIQNFLMMLNEEYDEYLACRFGENHHSTYEDLYDICRQLAEEEGYLRDNLAVIDFSKRIKQASFEYRRNYCDFRDSPISLKAFCDKAQRYIEYVIKYSLNERDIKGLDIFLDLYKAGISQEVFTLNHDLLVEKFSKENDIPFIDGFSESDGDIRWYNSDRWNEDAPVKIYKLHGSRNWYLIQHKKSGQVTAILDGSDNWHAYDADGVMIDYLHEDKQMLTGLRKEERYFSGIVGEAQFRFSAKLRKIDTLIISGYGWSDKAINLKIFDWLGKKSDNKVVIIHAEPENMIRNARYLNSRQVKMWQKEGQILFIEKWFEDVAVEDVEPYLNIIKD